MGGNTGYEFIDTLPNGNVRYKIYLYIYRNCDAQGSQSSLDNPLNFGVYRNNAQGSLYLSGQINSYTQVPVTPVFGNSSCSFQPNLCIKEVYYETIVTLAPSVNGYKFMYYRCCRNSSILNLQPDQGQTYYGIIPNTYLKNSSPRFNTLPVPYLCVNDLVTINNSATDIDGDQLTYVLAHPYAGGSGGGGPVGNNVPFAYGTPPLVTYNPGYNSIFPFGAAGTCLLNINTGFGTYNSSTVGDFVVAFDVIETRNGVVISKTRRDIQLFVLNCPPNSIPSLGFTGSTPPQTIINVNEGSLLTFPITLRDTNYMNITSTGSIFLAGGAPLPLPILAPRNIIAKDSTTLGFSWSVPCGAARAAPYTFEINAVDSGCPRKTAIFNFYIYVNKSATADSIIGNRRFCPNALETYSTNGNAGSTYTWSATNGSIVGANVGANVTIQWGALVGSGGTVTVTETTAQGCINTPFTLPVNVLSIPLANAGINQNICSRDTINLGANNDTSYQYKWTPSTYLNNDTLAKPQFTTTNATNTPLIVTYIVEVDYNFINCVNYSRKDTVVITVYPDTPKPNLSASTRACEFTQDTYGLPPIAGQSYQWQCIGGNIIQNKGDTIGVAWQNAGAGMIITTATDSTTGCVSLPDTTYINIQTKPKPTITGSMFYCINKLQNYIYTITNYDPKSQYNWSISGGTIKTINNSSVIVDWQIGPNPNYIEIIEINDLNCGSDPVRLTINYDNPRVEIINVTTLQYAPNTIELTWRGTGLANFQDRFYSLYYKNTTENQWTLATFLPPSATSFRFDNLDPNKYKYEFKITGTDLCTDTFKTTEHWNILLGSSFNEPTDQAALQWNEYRNWRNGVRDYALYIQTNSDTNFVLFDTYNNNTFDHTRPIDLETYKECYRIKANELSGNFSQSWSNIVCEIYPPYLYVPNAFTPITTTGTNDGFGAKGGRVKTFNMEIYNRWGELIYTTNQITDTWDGKTNGQPAPAGLYICLIKYTDGANWQGKYTNTINLIR
jgi:gliding motility-associated-like protein